jgi:uncharacterized protein YndB with AHSA1/START domain
MESTTETFSMTKELTIAARREIVWEYLVDAEKLTRWMGQEATFEAHEGGAYRVVVIPGHTASGEVVEVDPPHRLVFTWGWEPGDGDAPTVLPGTSTVEIELTATDAGTRLVFTHRDLPSSDAVDSHGVGWEHYLGRFVVAAGGGDPGRDPWLDGAM